MTTAALIIFLYFFAFFLVGTALRNNSLVDIGWGAGFVVVAWLLLLLRLPAGLPQWIVTLLITLWGGRLFWHILRRNLGKGEDFRYAAFRKAWGKWVVPRAFLQVYMLQGVFMYLISLSVILLPDTLNILRPVLLIAGVLVFALGFTMETIADKQLSTFRKNPANKGQLMTRGLWRYSRHPNYFGEATLWWGIFLIAVSGGVPWIAVISPLTITLLLRFVSGVPMLEKAMRSRPGFAQYDAQTSIFIPWFPKTNPLNLPTDKEDAR